MKKLASLLLCLGLACVSLNAQATREEEVYIEIIQDFITEMGIHRAVKFTVFVLPHVDHGSPSMVYHWRVENSIIAVFVLSRRFLYEFPSLTDHKALLAHEVGHLHYDCNLPTEFQQQVCADMKAGEAVGYDAVRSFLSRMVLSYPYDPMILERLKILEGR